MSCPRLPLHDISAAVPAHAQLGRRIHDESLVSPQNFVPRHPLTQTVKKKLELNVAGNTGGHLLHSQQ